MTQRRHHYHLLKQGALPERKLKRALLSPPPRSREGLPSRSVDDCGRGEESKARGGCCARGAAVITSFHSVGAGGGEEEEGGGGEGEEELRG